MSFVLINEYVGLVRRYMFIVFYKFLIKKYMYLLYDTKLQTIFYIQRLVQNTPWKGHDKRWTKLFHRSFKYCFVIKISRFKVFRLLKNHGRTNFANVSKTVIRFEKNSFDTAYVQAVSGRFQISKYQKIWNDWFGYHSKIFEDMILQKPKHFKKRYLDNEALL